MKIFIGTDHAGYDLKEKLKAHLADMGHEVMDMGALEFNQEDDYPDFIKKAAESVAKEPGTLGIILGGSGQGEAMCANRVQGVRAAEYYGGNMEIVKLAREHNDANILSLGARFVNEDEAKEAVRIFLQTPFSNEERHIRRIKKLENKN